MRGYAKLVQAIGEAAAAKLCAARGGWGVYIPQTGTGALGALLTAEQIDRMRDVFGDGTYTVPLGPASAMERAKRHGLELLAAGRSVADVVRAVRVSPSTVRRWRRLEPAR